MCSYRGCCARLCRPPWPSCWWRRIRMIAKFRRANNWSVLATSVAATLALVTLTDAQSGKPAASASQPHEDTQAKPEGPPRIVSTSPKVGEVEVSPGLTEITVTFDQDMEKGCSWTGRSFHQVRTAKRRCGGIPGLACCRSNFKPLRWRAPICPPYAFGSRLWAA
jgi:hypothetical protein